MTRPRTGLLNIGLFIATFFLSVLSAHPAELEQAQQSFLSGQYESVLAQAQEELNEGTREENWPILHIESLLTLGRYPEAAKAAESHLRRFRLSIALRLLARDAFLFNNQPTRATQMLEEIDYLGGGRMWAYDDPENLVALGKAALLLGAEPRLVLENFFDRAKQKDSNARAPHLAVGALALQKHDFSLAAEAFKEGATKFPEDPRFHHGLAEAYAPSDRKETMHAISEVLRLNPRHVPSLVLMADHMIDAEQYQEAETILDQVFAINPYHPRAWSYRTALEYLQGNSKGETRSRENALWFWHSNPEVDHVIGRELSQKYRFKEGSQHQRQALVFDPNYLPAQIQLAQDLLRLGDESGWALAERVHEADPYNVMSFNLVTLQDVMSEFAVLTNNHFTVRMAANEAALYGERVLHLLTEAKQHLCDKYGLTLDERVHIEIFPDQRDFAVRTFGMPDNPGFLGVCFGNVVTANSPAANPGHPNNWEAVLWHEFCHVVTLTLTRNKMPRWLSEGISVYEELEKNPAWGQRMTPEYREMILGDDLSAVSELSAAFLAPKSDLHLQFAYFQAALVVQFLVEKYGIESVRGVLRDLGAGKSIDNAIERHVAPLSDVDEQFIAYAQRLARELAPELTWDKPNADPLANLLPHGFFNQADNFYKLISSAQTLIEEKKWSDAKEPLQQLIEAFPSYTGPDNAYQMLALVHRNLEETDEERRILELLASRDSDAIDAFLRLMELGTEAEDWRAVLRNAERFLAVNPLLPHPYRHIAAASEQIGQLSDAIAACEKLLLLEPTDPAQLHFRLGSLLHRTGQAASAKRHILKSLEEAPRFRAAHHLLLQIVQEEEKQTTKAETHFQNTRSGASALSVLGGPIPK